MYQVIASSLVRRIRIACDQMADDIVDKRRLLEDMGRRTVIVFCDDDIELQRDDTLENIYYQVTVHECVALGQWHLKRPGGDPWDSILADIMQIVLDMRHELGATALPPRGMLARHPLEGVRIEMEEPYADQLYFARIALERPRFIVLVQATIDEEESLSIDMHWPGPADELWEFFQQVTASFAEMRRRVPGDWQRVSEEVVAALGQYQVGERVSMPGLVNQACGVAPVS